MSGKVITLMSAANHFVEPIKLSELDVEERLRRSGFQVGRYLRDARIGIGERPTATRQAAQPGCKYETVNPVVLELNGRTNS